MTVKNKRKILDERGFSLIELIIVVLIIAILATASIPAIQRNLQLYRLESATGLITSRLTEARLSAIKLNRSAWLAIDTTRRTLEVWTTNDGGQPVLVSPATPIPQDIILPSTSATTVNFTSLGRNQTNTLTNITLMLPTRGNCKTITIFATGKIATSTCP